MSGKSRNQSPRIRRTLLTGFGPFADIVDNPSERLALHFGESGASGHDLTVRILPVSFDRATSELEQLLVEGQFDLAVLMGVAGNESEIRIETCGTNLDSARIPDSDGSQPQGPIVESGAEVYISTLDSAPLMTALADAGIQARVSDSAGGYVCNHAYYAALHTIESHQLQTACIFIHVPPDATTYPKGTASEGMDFARQIIGIEAILSAISGNKYFSKQASRKKGRRTVAGRLI